ncbi:hypothetical protein Hanom_Chr07g00590821 [Helianthus anomalus]
MSTSSLTENVNPELEKVSGGLPPLNWNEADFDNIVSSLHFPDVWGAKYLAPEKTVDDPLPLDSSRCLLKKFHKGNFRLPITSFFGDILSHY